MKAADVEDIYALSPVQQGLLFHTVWNETPRVFFEQGVGSLEGELDSGCFERAWCEVTRRHGALRTSFHWKGMARPVQVVHRSVTPPFAFLDWRHAPQDRHPAMLDDLLAADRSRGIALDQPPLMRLMLIRTGEHQHMFVWSMHHLIHDSWSSSLLLNEMFHFYRAARLGQSGDLAWPAQYREYISWLKGYDYRGAEAFWRTYVGNLRPAPVAVADVHKRSEDLLTPEQTRAIGAFAASHSLTPYAVVHGMYAAALHSVRGSAEVTFGRVVSGRPADLPRVESIVGPLINTVPVTVPVCRNRTVQEWLREVQTAQLRQSPWEFAPLSDIQRWSGLTPGSALFDSILVFQNSFEDLSGREVEGLRITALRYEGHPNNPMMMRIWPGASMRLEISFAAHAQSTAQRLLFILGELLRRIPELGDAPLGELLGSVHQRETMHRRTRIADRLRSRISV